LYNVILPCFSSCVHGLGLKIENRKSIKNKIKMRRKNKKKLSPLFLILTLRCLHTSLSGPGVDEILHLTITLVNSSSKKGFQVDVANEVISLRTSSSLH